VICALQGHPDSGQARLADLNATGLDSETRQQQQQQQQAAAAAQDPAAVALAEAARQLLAETARSCSRWALNEPAAC